MIIGQDNFAPLPFHGQNDSCNICVAFIKTHLLSAAAVTCSVFASASSVRQPKFPDALSIRHWAPQYCHCSLDITAPDFQIVGFRNMSEAGASLIVPALSSPRRRVEVSEFLKSRMGADHDAGSKQTGSDALFDEVGPYVAIMGMYVYSRGWGGALSDVA